MSLFSRLFRQPDVIKLKSNGDKDRYKSEFTISVQEAIDICFSSIVPRVHTISHKEVNEEYLRLKEIWKSSDLYSGSKSYIIDLIQKNMNTMKGFETFKEFSVQEIPLTSYQKGAAQINIFHSGVFMPIRIWKVDSEYFVCGSSRFHL